MHCGFGLCNAHCGDVALCVLVHRDISSVMARPLATADVSDAFAYMWQCGCVIAHVRVCTCVFIQGPKATQYILHEYVQ